MPAIWAVDKPEEAPNALFEIISPNAELTTLNKLKNGGVTSDLFATYSKPVTASTIFTRVNALSLNDTSSSTTPDILFASHLGEWYVPRTKTIAIVSPIIFRRADIMKAAVDIFQSSTTSSTDGGIKTLYSAINVAGVSTSYGPFYNSECDPQVIALNRRDRTCQCAKGPRKFHVLSFLNMYDLKSSTRTSQFTYTQSGCGVTYRDALVAPPSSSIVASSGLSTAQIAGIAAGVASLFLLVALIVVGIYFCRRHMAVRYAPKDSSLPFAMAFTDIQSSTALWARAPEAMATSVDHHHAILRHCVKKYEGYEVKTIGDSFMVAFYDADSATRFALGVQAALYDFTKWAPEIDETYVELLLEQQAKVANAQLLAADVEDVTTFLSPSTSAPANVFLPLLPNAVGLDRVTYDSIWKGLRVRVGVHFGVGEIKRDKVSDRFDYYGTVVNTAARVEGVGHGGQVLLTDEAFHSLSADFDTKVSFDVLDLGPQPLRGLDAPVSLYQLTPMSVAARVYPPLRLDVENVPADGSSEDVDEFSDEDDDASSSLYSDSSALNHTGNGPVKSGTYTRRDPWSPEALASTIVARDLKRKRRVKVMSTSVLHQQTSRADFHAQLTGQFSATWCNSPLVYPPQSDPDSITFAASEISADQPNHPLTAAPIVSTAANPTTTSINLPGVEQLASTTSSLKENVPDTPLCIVMPQNDHHPNNTTTTLSSPQRCASFLSTTSSGGGSGGMGVRRSGSGRHKDVSRDSAYYHQLRHTGSGKAKSSGSRVSSGCDDPLVEIKVINPEAQSMMMAQSSRPHHHAEVDSHTQKEVHNNEAADAKKTLLTMYYFLVAALSTSTVSYRNDVVSHISKKWHIHNSKSPSSKLRSRLANMQSSVLGSSVLRKSTAADEAYDHMYMMMKLCAKVEKTATLQQKRSAPRK
eukprot:TRINITY_DN6652_c0_g2_i15.p1 TRINITY_DN6652_c0_g2~~TRINITY_DN6652_c0_g2_i15.p1  ORF type:complete len:922 (-),score=136.50 TRINITY_DN6652_c0_g2_i15:479-3244(-)